MKSPRQRLPRPKKFLGQNFLVDPHYLSRIVDACAFRSEDIVMEIGAGTGNLTRELIKNVRLVYAVEKDPQLCGILESELSSSGKIRIIPADILRLDWRQFTDLSKIVGNLPYGISTPVIEKMIENRLFFRDLFVTVQLEFGQRLTAKPPSKDYGSLSCFLQYFADVTMLFEIPRSCFRPIPKVTSCFLKIHFRNPGCPARNEKLLFRIIRQAFAGRRKKIINSLASVSPGAELKEILKRLKIPEKSRAEDLALTDYVQLANALCGS